MAGKKFSLFFFGLSAALILFFLAVGHLSDGFSINRISSTLEFNPEYKTECRNVPEILSILSQDFFYLGKGSQAYIFESEDGQWVLKFFRLDRYRFSKFSDHFSLPRFLTKIEKEKAEQKKKKLADLFQSCHLAWQELREESGLIYVHLNKTSYLHKQVCIFDKLQRPHFLNMDQYEFIIQKRAEMIYPYLSALIEKGNIPQAKASLAELVFLLRGRFQKGIFDSDSVIEKNMGFRFGKPMFIDTGQFSLSDRYQDGSNAHFELRKITANLRIWLNAKAPELGLYFQESLL